MNLNKLTEEQKRYLDSGYLECYPAAKEFTEKALEMYGSEEKLEEANKALDLFFCLGERDRLFGLKENASTCAASISALLLYNLFYDKDDWVKTLFSAREKLTELAKECNYNNVGAVFQSIEAQYGYSSPVPMLIMQPGHPAYFISQCIHLARCFDFKKKEE